MLGLKRKTVRLVPHDRRWARQFEEEKKKLEKILGTYVVAIEHIGSTSVPDLMAKPIIDIAVGVRTMKHGKRYVRLLEKARYFWRPNSGRLDQHILFAKGDEKKRTHYIHLFKYNGTIWKHDMAFRDYLRSHPSRARQYAKLKLALAKKYPNDRTAYTAGKSAFIENTLQMH